MALRRVHEQGLASAPRSTHRGDGLTLRGVYISASARCAPPDNKPAPRELDNCREYLVREMAALENVRVRMALGRIAFDAILKARVKLGFETLKPRPVFAHGAVAPLPEGGFLLASYHPSQQNTSTGLLTREMWRAVFEKARELEQS